MGYDMSLVVLKKKSLEEAQKVFPEFTFKEIYSCFLFSRLQPDEYEFPEDEEGRCVTWANKNIFKDFFEPRLKNDEAIIISEDMYNKMITWLEGKLKSKTLYDWTSDEECDGNEIAEMIRIYRQMKKENIDYETEFVVYQHDW